MSKYSTKVKIKIVKQLINDEDSINGLSRKYNISKSMIRRWFDLAINQGLMALSVKHKRQNYSIGFKINVVEYYLTHELGIDPVAAKFNISSSQVYSWKKSFEKSGYIGLKPTKKGRPPMKNNIKLELSEKERYDAKIAKLEKKIYDLELSNYCLKGLRAMMKDYPTN